jgi:beta-mannosidase
MIDLSGSWRVHIAEGDLHQRFVEFGFRDDRWPVADVPGHWRRIDGFEEADGPVLYRRTFGGPRLAPGRRRFLVLDGVFYFGDVWLDETYLGATEGYFMPHAFEITQTAQAQTEHTLAVEVACPRQEDPTAKRLITGVFSHWDTMDPEWNPGGLWRPVRLVDTGPARIARLRCRCTEATEARGRLVVDVTIDAGAVEAGPLPAVLTATLRGPGVDVAFTRDVALAAGDNHISWPIDVEHPPRWWPRRLGDQPLCDLEISVTVGGEPSDTCSTRTGFREVRLDRWVFHVNGERMFTMGANHPPTRMALADVSPDEFQRDVDLAIDANLDMLRIHAHVTRPEFYAAADERGLLLWQDFPLQWGYARGLRKSAVRQARAMVDQLGHHPSIALWCAHNEPLTVAVQPGDDISPGVMARLASSMFLPTWNKDVLDRSLTRALSKADGTRPVDRASGIMPGPFTGGTDSHLYFGWYHGEMGALASALRRWPRQARFVTEFGAQAVPDHADFCAPDRWPDLDWEHLFRHHALQHRVFARFVPPDEYATFDDWRTATQEYQAALLQLQCEDLRRLKYRPTGGFLQFCFADAHDAVTWSVLDARRAPKLGFAALRDACRPVLPMLEPRNGHIHVASERREPLPAAVVTVTGGGRSWRFEGDIAADATTFVGRVDLPDAVEFVLVTLEHELCGTVANRYGRLVLDGARKERWA